MVYKSKQPNVVIIKKGKTEINQMEDIDVTTLADWTTLVRDSTKKAFNMLPFSSISEWTPSGATAAWVKWQILFDANYLYICTATNTRKRLSLSR